MQKTFRILCVSALVWGAQHAVPGASLELAFPFSPHAVLQRGEAIPVWGTGTAGSRIQVSIAGVSGVSTCNDQGAWRIDLPPVAAGGPFILEVRSATESITVPDVLVGDVWLFSGQSNMVWPLKKCDTWNQDRGMPSPADMRFLDLNQGRVAASQPLTRLTGSWNGGGSVLNGEFSAIAYYAGLEFRQHAGVPIGLISASWGGTGIESWISPDALAASPASAGLAEAWSAHLVNFPAIERQYLDEILGAWRRQVAAARVQGSPIPRKPAAPRGPGYPELVPGSLFNGMIHPLIPYALKGVVWYQGEENASNAARAQRYRDLLPILVADWRHRFAREFGFHIVQLPGFGIDAPDDGPFPESSWAILRESQAVAARAIPRTSLTPIIDLGNPENIHPTNKKAVALRVARTVIAAGDDPSSYCPGPEFLAMEVVRDRVTVSFRTRQPLRTSKEPVHGFQIAGVDGRFRPCAVEVGPDRVILTAPGVREPVHVRYGWGGSPMATLVDASGMPAVPFRWPMW